MGSLNGIPGSRVGRKGTVGDPSASGRPGPAARGGFTLVEVVIASVVLVIAIGGLTGSILAGVKLSRSNEEQARAEAALRSAMARIQGTSFRDVFASYNADPLDDPGGLAPGAGFAVDGLDAVEGDPDGLPGEVIFPSLSIAGEEQLREDFQDPAFNMPRDLSGDGVVDALDHADDYRVLPVRVRVRWRGASGQCSLERSLLLVGP